MRAVKEIRWKARAGVTLAVVAKEMVNALLERGPARVEETHAPFSERGCCVTRHFGELGDRHPFIRQRVLPFGKPFPVAADGTMSGVEAGEE